MITKSQKRKLKKVLGNGYSSKVHEYLQKKGLRNRYGLPFSIETIRQVMNGRNHSEIESHIFSLYEEERKRISEEKSRRSRLLNKKTEASTSV